MIARLLLVCLGGAAGSGARYLTSVSFPHGTLIVNIIGSFLIGVLMQVSMSNNMRLMLTTGVMGGFTTYSAFNYETTSLLRDGMWAAALVNVAATFIGCLAAGFLGLWIGKLIR